MQNHQPVTCPPNPPVANCYKCSEFEKVCETLKHLNLKLIFAKTLLKQKSSQLTITAKLLLGAWWALRERSVKRTSYKTDDAEKQESSKDGKEELDGKELHQDSKIQFEKHLELRMKMNSFEKQIKEQKKTIDDLRMYTLQLEELALSQDRNTQYLQHRVKSHREDNKDLLKQLEQTKDRVQQLEVCKPKVEDLLRCIILNIKKKEVTQVDNLGGDEPSTTTQSIDPKQNYPIPQEIKKKFNETFSALLGYDVGKFESNSKLNF
jgi:seryl-tRNA synthetase